MGHHRLGLHRAEDGGELGGGGGVGGIAQRLARETELDHRGVAADLRGETLLLTADCLHLLVRAVGVDAGARRTGAVGHDDGAQAGLSRAVGVADEREAHEFDVVLVRADDEGLDAGEGGGFRRAVGDEDFGSGL